MRCFSRSHSHTHTFAHHEHTDRQAKSLQQHEHIVSHKHTKTQACATWTHRYTLATRTHANRHSKTQAFAPWTYRYTHTHTQAHTHTWKDKLAHYGTGTYKHRHASQTHSLTHHDTGTNWGMKLRIHAVAEDPKWPVGVEERWAAFKISPIKCLWLGRCISWYEMRSKWKCFFLLISAPEMPQVDSERGWQGQIFFLLLIPSKIFAGTNF